MCYKELHMVRRRKGMNTVFSLTMCCYCVGSFCIGFLVFCDFELRALGLIGVKFIDR